MRQATAPERHRAHHIRLGTRAFAAVLGALALLTGCGGMLGGLPRPPAARASATDYVPVPFAPRAPPVEFVPPSPSKDAVWVDGTWEWVGSRYVWRYGYWVVPPPHARYSRWVVVRRPDDGQLFFAPSQWRDASGEPLDIRPFAKALGPGASARARLGGPPRPIELDRRGGPRRAPPVDDELDLEGDDGD